MRKLFSLLAAVLFAGSMMAANFELFSGELVEGDYLITYDGGAMKASVASNRFEYAEITATADVVADPAANLVWHLAKVGDNWTIYNADQQKYAGSTNSKNQGALLDSATTDNAKWIVSGTATYEFANVARAAGSNPDNKWLRRNTTYGFACYASSTGGALTLYKMQSGEAPAVAKPAIAGEAFFYDSMEVAITCATEGASIYYTLDGTEPSAASTAYAAAIKLNATTTVKAIAIKGADQSAIAEKTFTKNPSFDSFEALVAAGLENNTLVEVAFADVLIDSIYVSSQSKRQGVYFAIADTAYEIYCNKADVPEAWEAGGMISGTIRGNWTYYARFAIWELVPSAADWTWENLTYEAETPQPVGLKAVSDSTTWDFAKVKAKTTSPLYSNSKEGILLTAETTPSITDEVIYADYDTTVLTIAAGFDAEAIAFTGEYPIRKDKYCMNGAVHFKTAVAGNIIVKFSDTGTSASATAVKRYLMVNGDSTQYWTSRENNGAEAPYAAQLNVVTEAIPVPAGDVVLTGSSAICVYYVTFIPDEPIIGAPEYYLAGDMNGWAANEAYKFAANPANEGEYMLTTALAVGDKFKVIGVVGATINWYPTGMGNDYVVDSLHAGEAKNIYFRPEGGQQGWYEGFFFVEPNEETMDSIPTTAPAAPTAAEDDVLAIYCNHYTTNNLNFAISGWAGGYETLTIDSTKIGFWTNMTWECIIDPAPNTDNAHDMSGYKKLHVDIWAPKAAKIKFTVEAVAGGNYKDGNVVNLVKGWNAFDFVVAEWPDNYDFKNVKCFVWETYQTPAGESFEGNPFAFANIYFYEKESQALDNTSDGVKAVKYIRNGMLLIEKNGKVYTITGQVVR